MAKALAYSRRIAFDTAEIARFTIVSACGVALIVAGQSLPL